MRGKSTSERNTHSVFHVPSNFNPSHLITATQSAAISVTHIPPEPGARILSTTSFPRPLHPHSCHTLDQHSSNRSKPVNTARVIPADQSAFRLHEQQDLLPTVGYLISSHLSKEAAQRARKSIEGSGLVSEVYEYWVIVRRVRLRRDLSSHIRRQPTETAHRYSSSLSILRISAESQRFVGH